MDIDYRHVAGYGIPGAILTTLSQFVEQEWLLYILLAVGILLLSLAGGILIQCLRYESVSILRRRYEAETTTAEERILRARAYLLDKASGMDEQAKAIALDNIHMFRVSYKLYDDTPLVWPTEAPYDFFVKTWLELCDRDGRFIAPIGTWSENSKERKWARQLTDLFIARGEVTESKRDDNQYLGGNMPPRWKSPEIYSKIKKFYEDFYQYDHSPTE